MDRRSALFFCLLAAIAVASVNAEVIPSSPRIAGGPTTHIDNLKYLVQLKTIKKFICGGALVSEWHVVSAAHCLKGAHPEDMIVVAGATYLSDYGVRSRIAAYVLPEEYNFQPATSYDIVVFRLENRLSGPSIGTVLLCSRPVLPKEMIQVSGWGSTYEGSPVSQQVRTVYLPTHSNDECSRRYAYAGLSITNTMFCAGAPGKRDSCGGDSGGPAIRNGELCGVVSWGKGCADQLYLGVYTNVFEMNGFINAAIDRLGGW